jgi:integrase
MFRDNLRLAEACSRDDRITDDLRPSSIRKYTSSIRTFFSVICDRNFTSLSNEDFDRFIVGMKERGASGARISNIIASMKWIIIRLQNKGLSFERPNLPAIRKPKGMKKETNYLTEAEIRQFFECIKQDIARRETIRNLRFLALVTLLMQTGARIGEAISIDIKDVDRENKAIRIVEKGGKSRKLFLRDETLQLIDRCLAMRRDNEQALFATQDGKSRWQQTDVGRSFRKYKRMSGIKKHL